MSHVSTRAATPRPAASTRGPGTVVVSEDLDKVLEPGHDGIGWLAQQGWVPLGYLGDADKTARTFPVIDGVRYSVPGDRARHQADGEIELLGRDSVTINSGGEKIFAEEVERAIAGHPAVHDVVVVGRPSERWGQEVVALVELSPAGRGDRPTTSSPTPAQHIARYKLPKDVLFLDGHPAQPVGQGRLPLGQGAGPGRGRRASRGPPAARSRRHDPLHATRPRGSPGASDVVDQSVGPSRAGGSGRGGGGLAALGRDRGDHAAGGGEGEADLGERDRRVVTGAGQRRPTGARAARRRRPPPR